MKKKSALFISISMVLVTILALTTASFAWFTTSLNPTVEGFDVQVTTSNALLIGVRKSGEDVIKDGATNGIAFGSSLSVPTLKLGVIGDKSATEKPNELLQNEANAANPKVLSNSTPAAVASKKITVANNAIAFSRLKSKDSIPTDWTSAYDPATNDKDGKDNGTGTDLAKPADEQNAFGQYEKDYILFDIYFTGNTSGAKDIKVSLDFTSETSGAYAGSDFYPTTDKGVKIPYAADVTKLYYITTALRVAFVPVKVVEATGAKVTTPAYAEATAPMKVLEIDNREPFKNSHIDADKAFTADYTTTRTATTGADIIKATTDMDLFTMKSNEMYRISVYMWIEGNDAQCMNEISASYFKSMFKFKGEAVTTPAP